LHTRRVSGFQIKGSGELHIKRVCGKGWAGVLPFVQPVNLPFCLLCSPPKFTFSIWKHGPPARPVRRPYD